MLNTLDCFFYFLHLFLRFTCSLSLSMYLCVHHMIRNDGIDDDLNIFTVEQLNFLFVCFAASACKRIIYFFFRLFYQTSPGSRSAVLRKLGGFWEPDVVTRASPALTSTKTPAAGRTTWNWCLSKKLILIDFDVFVWLWTYIYHPHSHSIFSIRVLHIHPEADSSPAMHISE